MAIGTGITTRFSLKHLNTLIQSYASNYTSNINDHETIRSTFLVKLFACVGLFFITLFGASSIIKGELFHGFFLLFISACTVLNFLFFHLTKNNKVSAINTVIIMGILELFLLSTGGVENTGPFWFYVFPLLALFVLGLKRGLIIIGALMLFSFVIMLYPQLPFVTTKYSQVFIQRFLASFLAVVILATVYEFIHQKIFSHLIQLSLKLDSFARKDALTGISNRRDMEERIAIEHNRFHRADRPYCLVLSDIDHFKSVNDSYGHDAGDYILQEMASLIQNNIRKLDCISRWGGEEFLILLSDIDLEQATAVSEKLRKLVEEKNFIFKDIPIKLSMSFGVHIAKREQSVEDHIKIADICLYQAKREGRNRTVSSDNLACGGHLVATGEQPTTRRALGMVDTPVT